MFPKILRTLPLAAALLAAPAALSAQQAAPAPTAGPDSTVDPRIQGWVAEIQQLNGRLQALQQQALQDPELNAAQESLGTRIKAAMEEADPTLVSGMERVETLQAEAVAAQQAGNQERLVELGRELQQMEQRFVEAQQQALARPDISGDLEAFQVRLEARLAELDPEAPQLIARFKELQQMLASAMSEGA